MKCTSSGRSFDIRLTPAKWFCCCLVAAVFSYSSANADDKSDKLTAILGAPLEQFRVGGLYGPPDDYQVGEFGGVTALRTGPHGLLLTSAERITPDCEVSVVFRMATPDDRGTSIFFEAGLEDPNNNQEGPISLRLGTAAGADNHALNWSISPGPGRTSKQLPYNLKRIPKNTAAWSAAVRERVDREIRSLPNLRDKWLTAKFIFRGHSLRVELDGRLVSFSEDPKTEPPGHYRLRLYDGAEVASLRVRKLPPADARFEPLDISRYLNSGKLLGNEVDLPGKREPAAENKVVAATSAALPRPASEQTIGGRPFLLPARDNRGNDHIDVGASRMRSALLEGMIGGWGSDDARWLGALDVDPSRLVVRIPRGRYSKLHLIAASDGEPDSVPLVSAQFFRAYAGHPVHFTARVPLFTADNAVDPAANSGVTATPLPAALGDGRVGRLWLVTIPLEPDGLQSLMDGDTIEMELTKEIRVYRSYPDPIYYTKHGAGLPSGVHVFAMTLERPPVDVDLTPDEFADIWTAPAAPSYTAKLKNLTGEPQSLELRLAATAHDGTAAVPVVESRTLPPGAEETVKLPLALNRHGYHDVELRVTDSTGPRTTRRSLAWLHTDTRERGRWQEGRGPLFGFWDWGGGHQTPGGLPRLKVMVSAGAESVNRSFESQGPTQPFSDVEKEYARAHGMQTQALMTAYVTVDKPFIDVDWDASQPEKMEAAVIAAIKKNSSPESSLNIPRDVVFYGEPVLGPISYRSLPENYGEPPYQMTEAEQKQYEALRDRFVIAARAIKREWPNARTYMPWGLPMFPIPFLRNSPEARELMDGPVLDVVLFERIPEGQLHQVGIQSQMWQLKQDWDKAGKPWPQFMSMEGPAVSPATPGALTQQQEADHTVRGLLLLSAWGTTRHLGWPTPFACGGDWGETHYGSGMCRPDSMLCPKICYAEYATLTRQLNRQNFVRWLPTGSLSTFCLQFKHCDSGELLHVLWNVRGTRPANVPVTTGEKVVVFDGMDNPTEPPVAAGQATFNISPMPCFVHGLKSDAMITLGDPDHTDSKPAETAARLAQLGDGTWKISTETDADYEASHEEFVRRYPGRMTSVSTEKDPGGSTSLAVHLEKQEKDPRVMPFYATLTPAKPLVIAGQASHLSLWAKAASDWGRVVYCLRDAKGERWTSVGKKGEWNCDDPHQASAFCYDGWRYLRFELPANAPYDQFREMGCTWWGPSGEGDGLIDLPLTLEKIHVERRTHAIYVTDVQACRADDVLLGGLFAEYENPEDATDEAVRLSRVRMDVK